MALLMRLHNEIEFTCEPTSRYLKYKALESSKSIATDLNNKVPSKCTFCGNYYNQSQQRVRLKPKTKLNKKLSKLLQKYKTDTKQLGKFQLNMVQNYLNSCNQLTITCGICKKTTRYQGLRRPDILQTRRNKMLDSKEHHNSQDTEVEKKKRKKKKKNKTEAIERLGILPKNNTVQQDSVNSSCVEKTESSPPSVSNVSTSSSVIKKTLNQDHKKMDLKQAVSKSDRKKKGKNMHQQLTKMLANEKKEKKSGSLMDFLSTL